MTLDLTWQCNVLNLWPFQLPRRQHRRRLCRPDPLFIHSMCGHLSATRALVVADEKAIRLLSSWYSDILLYWTLTANLQWFGQKTPWCFFDFRKMAFKVLRGDLGKRLLGVGVIWTKDSLVLTQPWHQGVFCPDHPNTKESFCQIKPQ